MQAEMQHVSVSLDGGDHYIVGTDKRGSKIRMKVNSSDLDSLKLLVRYLEREQEDCTQ